MQLLNLISESVKLTKEFNDYVSAQHELLRAKVLEKLPGHNIQRPHNSHTFFGHSRPGFLTRLDVPVTSKVFSDHLKNLGYHRNDNGIVRHTKEINGIIHTVSAESNDAESRILSFIDSAKITPETKNDIIMKSWAKKHNITESAETDELDAHLINHANNARAKIITASFPASDHTRMFGEPYERYWVTSLRNTPHDLIDHLENLGYNYNDKSGHYEKHDQNVTHSIGVGVNDRGFSDSVEMTPETRNDFLMKSWAKKHNYKLT